MARKSDYSEEIAEQICELIATTANGLHAICKSDEAFPHPVTFYRWINEHEALRNKYARAKELQAHFLTGEILDIADDSSNDTIHVDKGDFGYDIENKEWVNRSKLRIEARKWLAGKLAPKIYGDKIDVTSDGDKIQHNIQPIIKVYNSGPPLANSEDQIKE